MSQDNDNNSLVENAKRLLENEAKVIRNRRRGKRDVSLKEICAVYIHNNMSDVNINEGNSTQDTKEYLESIRKCIMCENITDDKLCKQHRKESIINLFR